MRWSERQEVRHQTMLNQFAYRYMKECESKSMYRLCLDRDFHRECFNKMKNDNDMFVIADKHSYLTAISRNIAAVRFGLMTTDELKQTEEVRAAVKWAKRHDGEFYRKWKTT